jgi:hypothetical protein
LFDKNNGYNYNWGKRFENLWTWVTLSYKKDTKEAYFYINDDLTCQMNGVKQKIPFPISDDLRSHNSISPLFVGFCKQMNTYYKGKIGEVKIFNKFVEDIEDAITGKDDLVLHYDFKEGLRDNASDMVGINNNVKFTTENIEVIENILPFRREGSLYCIPHPDEGYVNGGWFKGETTARNEKRLVTEMQQQKIDYKNDGMNTLKYELVSTEMFLDNCLMINVTL